jgi:hypothetical membrane protein
VNKLKIVGVAGLVAPPFVFTCIFTSIATWPHFSWVNNALSDLGVQNGATAIIFNTGLIVGGLLFIIFATGLFNIASKHVIGKAGTAIFVLACLMLIAIGVFNENLSPTHYLVSVGLFVFMPISMLTLTVAFWAEGKHRLSVFTFALAISAAAVWVLEFTIHYASGVAIPEFISGLAGAIWVMVISYIMLKQSSK